MRSIRQAGQCEDYIDPVRKAIMETDGTDYGMVWKKVKLPSNYKMEKAIKKLHKGIIREQDRLNPLIPFLPRGSEKRNLRYVVRELAHLQEQVEQIVENSPTLRLMLPHIRPRDDEDDEN